MSRTVYVNGVFLPEHDAKISIFDRGFIFADGIYEVSAVMAGKLLDNDAHLKRLERSLGEIGMPMPMPAEEIVKIQKELIARNDIVEGTVYLQVTRGAADRDFPFPPADTMQTLVMFTQKRDFTNSPAARAGIRMATVRDIRWERRDIKSVALLAQVLAKQAAAEKGCQEAIMHTADGVVTEGGSSTIFIVTANGELVTRPLSNEVLPGITRQSLKLLCDERGVPFIERAFTVDEALAAPEVFVTSAGSFVTAVVEIDGKRIGGGQPGPVARRLREIYLDEAVKAGV
ncbi:MAG: D-amino acid aminotransferase [Rhizobiales bacterium 65-9]|nr:D-amino-acid transaminase [Hyphomicrobiales bacterium]OJY38128.1 MAG: D-amino acid aminotransferase [Rhizobiales bacterium 65-9]